MFIRYLFNHIVIIVFWQHTYREISERAIIRIQCRFFTCPSKSRPVTFDFFTCRFCHVSAFVSEVASLKHYASHPVCQYCLELIFSKYFSSVSTFPSQMYVQNNTTVIPISVVYTVYKRKHLSTCILSIRVPHLFRCTYRGLWMAKCITIDQSLTTVVNQF